MKSGVNGELLKKFVLKSRRRVRVRKRLKGSAGCPRMCVVKSNRHLSVQMIDDKKGHTLVSLSTFSKDGRELKKNQSSAHQLGILVGKKAVDQGIRDVVFDRGDCKYHGLLSAIADGARESGLKF